MPVRESVERLLGRFRDVVDVRRIARAIESGNGPRLTRLLEEAWATLSPGMRAEFQRELVTVTNEAYGAGWRQVTDQPYTPPRAAVGRARTQSARLVTAMNAQGRRTIRILVTGAIAGGADNPSLARELVRTGLGVHRIQAGALAKLSARLGRLVEDGDITAQQANKRLDRRAAGMIRSRSRTIARTETADAQGWGRQHAWDVAERRGIIDDDRWEKVWVIRDDPLTTDLCRRINGKARPIHGNWEGYEHPPRHPNCRCVVVMRRKTRGRR